MLRNFRSVFKGKQGLTGGMMLILSVGMLTYLLPGGGSLQAPETVVARVYGKEILYRDFLEAVRNLQRSLGKQANLDSMMPFIQSQAIRGLVQQGVMEEMAERRGVVVTDDEVLARLKDDLTRGGFVQPNGQLMPREEIEAYLRDKGFTLAMVERDIKRALVFGKLQDQAAAQVPVTAEWLDRENRVRNEKVAFDYVAVVPDENAVKDPGDAVLDGFLKAGGARFQQAPRRVAQFVALTPATLGDAVRVTDDELKKTYEANKTRYQELKVSHILFKATTESEFKAAQAKAEALRPKLTGGQDFNNAAEEQSQDPSAKVNKGDMGWFKSGAMVKPFEDAARALKIGEISQPVRTQFGVHLIKLEGRREKSFEEAKVQLKDEQERQRFTLRAKERLEQLRKRAGDRGDISTPAKNLNLKIATTPPLLEEDSTPLEGVTISRPLIAEMFRLKVGDVSKVLQAGDAYAVLRVIEEKPTGVPPLGEIRAKVLAAWKLEEARKATVDRVRAALASGGLQAAGTVQHQAATTLQALGELGQHPGIRKALLETSVGGTTPPIWNPTGHLWVATVTERTPAEALPFDKRNTLLGDIQRTQSEKQIQAELGALEQQGRLHPGLSSLWGRLNGIWVNPKLAETKLEGGEEE
ncbi:MAG: peptidyl-prolyl cis-trans isomerase [Acidobacteria bacterium]|nr:peptidyl-prolyl cis-trans isomerase [Acidobacteriota bacterium]